MTLEDANHTFSILNSQMSVGLGPYHVGMAWPYGALCHFGSCLLDMRGTLGRADMTQQIFSSPKHSPWHVFGSCWSKHGHQNISVSFFSARDIKYINVVCTILMKALVFS
jgi:hypothetical protein